MELNFSELDDSMNPHPTTSRPTAAPKRKKTSFNDILSNMNLVVDANGVLQYMSYQPQAQAQAQAQAQVQTTQPPEIHKIWEQGPHTSVQQVDSNVKHSYIYNKYFKDYHDPNAPSAQPRVPKTREEYIQMLQEANEQRKRIRQIKSTQMLYTSTPGVPASRPVVASTRAGLRSMNFT